TINDFVTDLKANTVGPASANGAFLSNIDNSLNTLLDTRTRVGARMNAVDQQRAVNENIKASMETMLSQVEDLDYAEAISRLNLQMTGLQAAQQSFVKVQGLSLFNYL
ncbi:MAG: flagellin, partial [Gammaproteobacteria bacterium]|nr:flagellin [Gammaproteobacteria bacterium]